MCSLACLPPPADIGKHWTDEEVFKSLMTLTSGSPLPSNVTADVNPYQCLPSNLPEELWYLCSEKDKDSKHGFWMAIGEPCRIPVDSVTTGWRTTLEFYEGHAPHQQRTDWVMQEYTITEKELYDNRKPKDSGALCRVFLADAKLLGHELLSKHDLTDIAEENSSCFMPIAFPNANSSTEQNSKSELPDKNLDNVTGPSDVAKISADPSTENMQHWFLGGDYLELNDLIDPELRSSSSDSSIMSSEAYFDSVALLNDLEEGKDQGTSSRQFNLSASVKSKEVIMCPVTVGSLGTGIENKSPRKGNPSQDYNIRKQQHDHGNGSTSSSHNKVAASTNPKSVVRGEKKDHVSRIKKLKMKYFCFMAF